MLEAEGIQTLAVHPRLKHEKFKGRSRWDRIAAVREARQDSGGRQRGRLQSLRTPSDAGGNRLRRRHDRPRGRPAALGVPRDRGGNVPSSPIPSG